MPAGTSVILATATSPCISKTSGQVSTQSSQPVQSSFTFTFIVVLLFCCLFCLYLFHGPFLIKGPTVFHVFLRQRHQALRCLGTALKQLFVAHFAVGVLLERNRRFFAVDDQRILTFIRQHWIVAEEYPVAALDRFLLMLV